jgi:hypothetical protein
MIKMSAGEVHMPRQPSTRTDGSKFDRVTIDAVWGRATPERGYVTFRKDKCGASMQRRRYGQTGDWGWEIDHIKPVSLGGTDDLRNLQPLHWRNNRHKGDNYPDWDCAVTE